jgi:hypothetical protein
MSWCRWSSQNYQCDLYIYDSVGDFVSVNVAGRKHAWALIPDPSMWCLQPGRQWLFKTKPGWVVFRLWRALWNLDRWIAPWRDVRWKGGESFQFTDMNALATFLLEARQNGLRFPDHVWACLVETATEDK